MLSLQEQAPVITDTAGVPSPDQITLTVTPDQLRISTETLRASGRAALIGAADCFTSPDGRDGDHDSMI